MNPLITYLNQIRPYINAVAINELAGTENLLGKHFHYIDTNGEKGQLLSPKRYFDVLSALIKAFGEIKIGRWTYYDSNGKRVFACATMKTEIIGGDPPLQKELVQHCNWDKDELLSFFVGTQELTTAPPGS